MGESRTAGQPVTLLQRVRRRAYQATLASDSDLLPSVLATAYVSFRQRRLVRASRDGDIWVFEFSDGAVVDTRIRQNFRPPENRDDVARDIFVHTHTGLTGGVILDIGAGVGGEAAAFSHAVGPRGKVHCFEAHPIVYRCLRECLTRNELANAKAHHVAVGATRGSIQIESALDGHISNSVMTGDGDVEVPMLSLDEFCSERGIDEVALLKMNIEGAELDALRGAEKILQRTRAVSISCHDFKAERTGNPVFATRAEVTDRLQAAGFDLHFRPEDPRPWVRDTVYGTR